MIKIECNYPKHQECSTSIEKCCNLINTLKTTEDDLERNDVALALSDIKCHKAVDVILELIERDELRDSRGTLIYSLQELELSSNQLFQILKLTCDSNFEVRCSATELIESHLEGIEDKDQWITMIEDKIVMYNHILSLLEELYDELV